MVGISLAKNIAKGIINDFNISDPVQIDLEGIAAERGAFIKEEILHATAGRLIRYSNKGIITVNAQIKEEGKKRFVAAHELGHFEIHKKLDQINICTDEDLLDWYKTSSLELESNAFAAELLMPETIFKNVCVGTKPNFEIVRELAFKFNTTITATTLRYVEIGPYPCAIIVSKDQKISWYRASYDFPFRLKIVGTKLDPTSCALAWFEKGSGPLNPEMVLGSAWLDDYRLEQDCYLYEHSFFLKSYKVVLSLIWLFDETIFNNDDD